MQEFTKYGSNLEKTLQQRRGAEKMNEKLHDPTLIKTKKNTINIKAMARNNNGRD